MTKNLVIFLRFYCPGLTSRSSFSTAISRRKQAKSTERVVDVRLPSIGNSSSICWCGQTASHPDNKARQRRSAVETSDISEDLINLAFTELTKFRQQYAQSQAKEEA